MHRVNLCQLRDPDKRERARCHAGDIACCKNSFANYLRCPDFASLSVQDRLPSRGQQVMNGEIRLFKILVSSRAELYCLGPRLVFCAHKVHKYPSDGDDSDPIGVFR